MDEQEHTARDGFVTRRRVSMRSVVAVLTAVSMAGAVAGCGSLGASASTQALRIGLIVPMTGSVAADGIPMKNGFDLALKSINASGGVLGKKIQVVTLDDQSDPALAAQDALKLIRQDRVDLLAGTITGAEAAAAGHVATSAKVPLATFIMGSTSFCTRYFWPFGETNAMLLKPLIPVLLKRWGKRVALVGSDYDFPHQYNALAKQLIEAGGGTVVAEQYAPLGTSDWGPVINKLRNARPDWILSAVVGGDAVAFAKQAQQFGLLATAKLTGVSLIQEYYPAISGIANGALLVSRYSEQLPGQANAAFVRSYRAAYGEPEPIPNVAATAYEGLHFIAKAVQNAGSPDAAKVNAQMAKTQISGFFGSDLHFAANHHFKTPMFLVRIAPGGKYVPLATYRDISDNEPCAGAQ